MDSEARRHFIAEESCKHKYLTVYQSGLTINADVSCLEESPAGIVKCLPTVLKHLL